MKKKTWLEHTNDGLLTLFLLVLFVTGVMVNYRLYNTVSKPVTVEFIDPDHIDMGEMAGFLVVAKRFSMNHVYTTEYNCMNYSKDLKDIADALGYDTRLVKGCPLDNSTCHAWLRLEIDFDPQNAAFMDYSKMYPNQEVVG